MAESTDLQVLEAQLRHRVRVWRIAAMGAFAAALLVAGAGQFHMHSRSAAHQPHLARLQVDGVIGSDVTRWVSALSKAEKDSNVKGLILAINSPGGAVTGGEEMHDAVARFAAHKPVVVTMGGVAASAGYMIAAPAQRIFAEQGTLTGSIGVIMEAPDVSGLLGKVGVSVDQLVSGPMKGQPSMVKPLSPEGREVMQGIVADLYDQFVTMVVQGRHMPEDRVRALADGRPYTGRQALKLGLIDSIGSPEDAKRWLLHTCNLTDQARVETIGEKKAGFSLRHRLLSWMLNGVSSEFGGLADSIFPEERISVDGAVAIWKP